MEPVAKHDMKCLDGAGFVQALAGPSRPWPGLACLGGALMCIG